MTTLEGVTVPGYDILAELGRGHGGVVYKARHHRLQPLGAEDGPGGSTHVGQVGLARFRAEAEAVAKLLHPNIVRIFENRRARGPAVLYLARGTSRKGAQASREISQSPARPSGAAQFVETLAAHHGGGPPGAGIIHRDLKPANILLATISTSQSSMIRFRDTGSSSVPEDHWARSTVPRIADFGLAKLLRTT